MWRNIGGGINQRLSAYQLMAGPSYRLMARRGHWRLGNINNISWQCINESVAWDISWLAA